MTPLFGDCPLSSSMINPLSYPAEIHCCCTLAWGVAAGLGHLPLYNYSSKEGSKQILRMQKSASV